MNKTLSVRTSSTIGSRAACLCEIGSSHQSSIDDDDDDDVYYCLSKRTPLYIYTYRAL